MAVSLLIRAISLAQQHPFTWGYIDKPSEGQLYLIFLTSQLPFSIDGIRYQDQEQRYTIPAGSGRELEVMEVKFGFIPGSDTAAYRVRRRFRLAKGGHPQLVLVHYSRGQSAPILSSLNQPARSYPLRPVNEPAVFVIGEKQGQKVYQNTGGPPMPGIPPTADRGPAPTMTSMGMNFGANPQARLAQQNSSMEALERRSQRERSASMSTRQPPPQVEDDDSADESDLISTRTLALTRYRRNHELMNEVFMYAAFGDKKRPAPPPPYSIFKMADLEEKSTKLTLEIETLKAKMAARRLASVSAEEAGDGSMESVGPSVEGITT
ncbi:SWI/SNF and RSC complexes subunit ssr4 [Grifola frondosa]|uniref:SWI/SNF and RSC complexes subunit ssr4 n=1 Tax=Grifola frondosa TaxID=5627 RepID=A0A1C7M2M1_GRIFR|nr:SWI/SNF and RSC complexes subunit ssr4 [Grifola frondosa]